MPEQSDAKQLIDGLPCTIKLPVKWNDYFDRSGPLPPCFDDLRRFPRFYLRSPAALQNCGAMPALQRAPGPCRIYIKDISRSSVAFIHSEQLYPRENLRVMFIDGKVRSAEVLRCRRHQDSCFEVVVKFVDGL
jgi:hypothetical protein